MEGGWRPAETRGAAPAWQEGRARSAGRASAVEPRKVPRARAAPRPATPPKALSPPRQRTPSPLHPTPLHRPSPPRRLASDVGKSAELLSDLLSGSKLSPDAVERERDVILREMEEVEGQVPRRAPPTPLGLPPAD